MSAAAALELLRGRGLSLATAESLTGGMLGTLVTDVPGASDVYVGGVISYATATKQDVLGVDADLIARHGVISAACAEAMAVGVRALLGADWAISTTGVAGPDSQDGQPVGTVFIGLAGPGGVTSRQLALDGDRRVIRVATCDAALVLLTESVGATG